MKRLPKFFALLLSAVLGLASLSACSDKRSTTPPAPPRTDPPATTQPSGPAPSPTTQPSEAPGEQSGETAEPTPSVGVALGLSHESGAYGEAFTLEISKAEDSHHIYYTLDGSLPSAASPELTGGLRITENDGRDYPVTAGVLHDAAGFGNYVYGTGNAATVVRLLETDAEGAVVATRTETFLVREGGAAAFPIPVVSLSLPPEDALGFYNDIEGEGKRRAELAYFDFGTGERFACNTQIKLGGNVTKGYPYRTVNVNFAKDENGEKNDPVTVELFPGRTARNGGQLTNFKRFRLHSGGNAQILNWFGDAFTQRVAAEVDADGAYLDVATTGYRPVEVYLNGEYWGIYAIREHYSDVYFEQNYGVDKDDVILLDKSHAVAPGNPACSDKTIFDTSYQFEIAEDDEAHTGMEKAKELFDFALQTNLSDAENYRKFAEMVDIDSLIDLVLVHFYAGNWDFMYNNIKMWRTASVDPSNPYADGKWRFCLHDLDFSFEFQWGDSGIENADAYRLKANYLDFYLGKASLLYNGAGYLNNKLTCLLSAPMRNADFRAAFLARASFVKRIYNDARAFSILDDMEREIAIPMQRHLYRWQRQGYGYADWQYFVERTRTVLAHRAYLYDELNRNGGQIVYPDGTYFEKQVEAAINRFIH